MALLVKRPRRIVREEMYIFLQVLFRARRFSFSLLTKLLILCIKLNSCLVFTSLFSFVDLITLSV